MTLPGAGIREERMPVSGLSHRTQPRFGGSSTRNCQTDSRFWVSCQLSHVYCCPKMLNKRGPCMAGMPGVGTDWRSGSKSWDGRGWCQCSMTSLAAFDCLPRQQTILIPHKAIPRPPLQSSFLISLLTPVLIPTFTRH
jgi:hypothetical protein